MSKSKTSKPLERKILIKHGILYAVILALVNLLGYLIVSTTKVFVSQAEESDIWTNFLASNHYLIGMIMFILSIIPFAVLAYYVFSAKEEYYPSRMINFPVRYAFIGSVGWILPYLFEFICLCYIDIKYEYDVNSLTFFYFITVIEAGLFVGVLTFLTLDYINRIHVLPKYFPEGKLSEYEGTQKIQTKSIISVIYLSVGIIPVLYLLSAMASYSILEDFKVDPMIYAVAFGIIILGHITLAFFSGYFTKPLAKLKDSANEIKQGHFDERVDIVSADDFGDLADNFNDMAHELKHKNRQIFKMQNSIIRGMAVMVESNDLNTGEHIIRTSDCVKILVKRLVREKYRTDLDKLYWMNIIKAAPMHDLGKISVDDAVLRKPGRFTPEEYEIMKNHTTEGARIVELVLKEVNDSQFKNIAVNVAHFHHEKWDGSGYPTGISGENIPLEARIMALADVFDALVSKRCYKDEMPFDQAFEIIENSLGTHFDPELGHMFLKCRSDLEEMYTKHFDYEKEQ